jgi:hypothetical protein
MKSNYMEIIQTNLHETKNFIINSTDNNHDTTLWIEPDKLAQHIHSFSLSALNLKPLSIQQKTSIIILHKKIPRLHRKPFVLSYELF